MRSSDRVAAIASREQTTIRASDERASERAAKLQAEKRETARENFYQM